MQVLVVWLCCHVFKLLLIVKLTDFYNDRLLFKVKLPICDLVYIGYRLRSRVAMVVSPFPMSYL